MLEHRVQLKVIEWEDVAFRTAVERAWATIRLGPDDADSVTAAAHLQLLIRGSGYPRATVTMTRTVEEALAHVSEFEVRREPVRTRTVAVGV